ncbi:amidohydrolase [Thiosocius teredinicola]|uniref:amidohydrolase n=1 Tax=Thiosocius teredinicola TaxID=1973002 RepID=UPI000990D5AD
MFRTLMLLTLVALISGVSHAAPDTILYNGKILTVDADFSTRQALAIESDRISATGTDEDVLALADAQTRKIDLQGRTVIPGLIDNHVHIVRGARQWTRDVRLTGVLTRAEAKRLIAERAEKLGDGEWVLVLGGFTPEQFSDDRKPFTREELDEVAPNNPVFMQVLFGMGYANSQAFRAIDIDEDTEIAWLEIANDIDLDANERPTGTVRGAAMNRMLAKVAEPDLAEAKERALGNMRDLHAMGVTSVLDAAGGTGLDLSLYEPYVELEKEGKLKLRLFNLYSPAVMEPGKTGGLDQELSALPFMEDSNWLQRTGVGERLYNPIHDSMLQPAANGPQHKQAFADLAKQVAAKRLHLHQHATHPRSMKQHLDAFEAIDKQYSLKELRWVFAHADGIDPEILPRAKALGMGIASHSRRLISGKSFSHPLAMLAFGNPPLKTIQASGITWGLGTDTMVVNQSNPFYTLWWAVSGRAMNGDQLTDETVTREQALIAHTRSNAWLVFREDELGSLEPGKFADLLVLDRDYLTVPEVEIRRIKPLLTMVGGEIVYGELP